MFQKIKNVFKSLSKSESIELTKGCQTHVLAARMHQAGLRHNDQALVDLQGVRLTRGEVEGAESINSLKMFFCPLEHVVVRKKIKEGDHGWIDGYTNTQLVNVKPPKASLKRKSGVYNLTNVLICANGSMTIEATAKTKWEKATL